MTCPFCGAREYKAVPGEFACGSGIEPFAPFEAKQSEPCRELCQLREKKAQGLTWETTCKGKGLMAETPHGYMMILVFADECRLINRIRGEERRSNHATLDAAKAHAEELHQQAWRELRERWDYKGGGK